MDSLRFQVLTVVGMSMTVFWDVAPCSLVYVYKRFGGAYCPHHQGTFWGIEGYSNRAAHNEMAGCKLHSPDVRSCLTVRDGILERPDEQATGSFAAYHKQYYVTKQNKHGHHHDHVILDDDVGAPRWLFGH
jgi:hypothetical protein